MLNLKKIQAAEVKKPFLTRLNQRKNEAMEKKLNLRKSKAMKPTMNGKKMLNLQKRMAMEAIARLNPRKILIKQDWEKLVPKLNP